MLEREQAPAGSIFAIWLAGLIDPAASSALSAGALGGRQWLLPQGVGPSTHPPECSSSKDLLRELAQGLAASTQSERDQTTSLLFREIGTTRQAMSHCCCRASVVVFLSLVSGLCLRAAAPVLLDESFENGDMTAWSSSIP